VSRRTIRDLTQELARVASAVRESEVPPSRSQLEEVGRVAAQLAAMSRKADNPKEVSACRHANSLVTGCQDLLEEMQRTDLTDPRAAEAFLTDVVLVLDPDVGDLLRLFPTV
jgi:hypothetical protein